MNTIDFMVGNKTQCLSLTTRSIVQLERQIGCNPLMLFMTSDGETRVPSMTEMVAVLHASLTRFNHGITLNDAYDIMDDYIADGHATTDFIPVMIELFQASGIMPKETEEKNA